LKKAVFLQTTLSNLLMKLKNNNSKLHRIGLVALTHTLSSLCGLVGSLILINISIHTNPHTDDSKEAYVKQKTIYDIVADILRNLIPRNIIKATTSQELTRYYAIDNRTDEYQRRVEYIEGTNTLGV
jgi:Na+/H+-dicarboxylate symporter